MMPMEFYEIASPKFRMYWNNACRKKKTYSTEKAAMAATIHVLCKHFTRTTYYKCHFCDKYHLTSKH